MTRWKERFDVIQNILEWLLIALMLAAAVYLIIIAPTALPAGAEGPVASLFGQALAVYIYAIIWMGESVLLALAKWFKWSRIRKWTLFAIFLTHTFTVALAWSLRGIGWHLADNVVIVLLSAWLWLRAKLQYEYIEYEELNSLDE
jgi:hypothetical protein